MQAKSLEEVLEEYIRDSTNFLIRKFDPSFSEFIAWECDFKKVMRRLEVPQRMKVPFLLKLIKPHVLIKIMETTGLTDLRELQYKSLANLLQDTFKFEEAHILFRRTFAHRIQEEGEEALQFFRSLKELSKKCRYEDSRGDLIKQQFIDGLRNEEVQSVLRQMEDRLTWRQMEYIAAEIDFYEEVGKDEPFVPFSTL